MILSAGEQEVYNGNSSAEKKSKNDLGYCSIDVESPETATKYFSYLKQYA